MTRPVDPNAHIWIGEYKLTGLFQKKEGGYNLKVADPREATYYNSAEDCRRATSHWGRQPCVAVTLSSVLWRNAA